MTSTYKPNTLGYQVLTPNGFQDFAGISLMGFKKTIELHFEGGVIVRCTPDHKIYCDEEFTVEADKIAVGSSIMSSDGPLRLLHKLELSSESEPVFDLIEVANGHRYYANTILSSNCEFLIEDDTLVNSSCLLALEGVEPKEKQGQVRWYQTPKKGKMYIVALDPSLGTGRDPAAIEIFEANSLIQVGEWRHNATPIQAQIKLMAEIIKYIHGITQDQNNIYYSVENNTIGEAALISINEYGEQNIPAIFLTEPHAAKSPGIRQRKGFNTTNKSKIAACAKFKHLLESGRLKIFSKPLISELKNFVAIGNTYAARPGETDDLVMSSLLVVRMLQYLQNYHVELTDKMRDHTDDVIAPMPFIVF